MRWKTPVTVSGYGGSSLPWASVTASALLACGRRLQTGAAGDGKVLEDDQALEERRAAGHARRAPGPGRAGCARTRAARPRTAGGAGATRAPARRARTRARTGSVLMKRPDHPLDAGDGRGSTRHGGAEDHVLFAADAREQDRPRALHERARGQPAALREGRQRRAGRLGQGHDAARRSLGPPIATRGVWGGLCPIATGAERRRGRRTPRAPAPERLDPALVLLREPADELTVRSRPIEVDRAAPWRGRRGA